MYQFTCVFIVREARIPLDNIVEQSFPLMQVLLINIIQNHSLEAAHVIRLILKIFWTCTQYQLPSSSNVDVNLWFTIFSQLLEKKLPEASEGIEPYGQPISKEERNDWPWWKVY